LRTLLVIAHPRRTSLTGQAADAFCAAAEANGHTFEWADLAEEGFDPVLRDADEPDWNDPDKVYSEAVRREMQRIERNAATVMIFPVYWWSMPALLKGWIDRVWNNGWAYGARRLPHQRALLVGTAAGSAEDYRARGYDQAMLTQLVSGIMNYCGIPEADLRLLYDVTDSDLSGGAERRRLQLKQVRTLGRSFDLQSA